MPNETDSIMVDELEWRGRFVNRALTSGGYRAACKRPPVRWTH